MKSHGKNTHNQPTRFHPDNLPMIPVTNSTKYILLQKPKQKYNLATRKKQRKTLELVLIIARLLREKINQKTTVAGVVAEGIKKSTVINLSDHDKL
ncbi:hypothetical protein OIU84_007684 [Salix udensis]|uniref:Uncharacterized protein n=1 Tax=Salix udensis TaxID=889485 RepID=A0AAD6NZQ0_9ROSI|nr:hypothetical protein OIU84_007684 [Salix udensis]